MVILRDGEVAEGKRARILDAAGELFKEKGYEATSIADIAAKAGFRNKGSIYNYFKGKEEIAMQVFQRILHPTTEKLKQIRDSDLPWPEKVRRSISMHLDGDYISSYRIAFTVLSELYVQSRRRKNKRLFLPLREHDKVWMEIILQGVEQGYVHEDSVDPKLLYLFLSGAWNWVYKWYSPRGPLTLEKIREQLAELFMKGCISRDLVK